MRRWIGYMEKRLISNQQIDRFTYTEDAALDEPEALEDRAEVADAAALSFKIEQMMSRGTERQARVYLRRCRRDSGAGSTKNRKSRSQYKVHRYESPETHEDAEAAAEETALDAPATAPVDEAADDPLAAEDDPDAAAFKQSVEVPAPMVMGEE